MKHIGQEDYLLYWRYRITEIVVYLIDENNKVIPNFEKNRFGVTIRYPNLFYDMDKSKVAHLFGAHPFKCTSTYLTDKEPKKRCHVSSEFQFAGYIFSPSPNGTFRFSLRDRKNQLNLTSVHKLRIDISGTHIEFSNSEARKSKLIHEINHH